jgi:hypothetical protein
MKIFFTEFHAANKKNLHMKNTLLFLCLVIISCTGLHAQNCSVHISGGNCIGTELTADINGGKLSKLSWYQDRGNIFTADTISSPASVFIVAGNHGSGSSSTQLGFPAGGISVDAAGNVYVADNLNNRVQKWAPGATAGVTVAGGHGAGSGANQLSGPRDVFVDADGNIYVADGKNARIQKWAPGATSGITVAGGNGPGSSAKQFNGPRGLYVDNKGNIYVADTYNYRIQKWKPGANKGVTVAGGNGSGVGADQFYYPIDVYLDAAKNIYIADAFSDDANLHRVQKWAPGATSGVTVAGGNGAGNHANQFGYLLGIYVDAGGTIYAADNGVDGGPVGRIQKWTPGAVNGITVAGGHSNGWDVLTYPTGITLDNNGNIYVFNGIYNPRVQKNIPTNGIVDKIFSPAQAGTYSVQAEIKNGCTAASNSLVVRAVPEIYRIEATQPKGRGNLCSGGIDTFSVYAWDDITHYTWKLPSQCSLISNLNDSVIIAVPAGFTSGKLIVSGNNICGTSEPDTLHLQGRPLLPGNIKGLKHVFANQNSIVYSVDDVSSNHNWIVPEGAVIQSGQGTSSIIVNWGTTSGIVSVNSYNDCGETPLRKETQVLVKNSFADNEQVTGEKLNNKNEAFVFPNPANDVATIKFNAIKQSNYSIELQNMSGVIFMQKNIIAKPGLNIITINVNKFPAGLYIINIKNAEEKISLKLAKQ